MEGELGLMSCEGLAVEVIPDYVHVFALCPPRPSPAYIMNYLKARKILQKFPELESKASFGKQWGKER